MSHINQQSKKFEQVSFFGGMGIVDKNKYLTCSSQEYEQYLIIAETTGPGYRDYNGVKMNNVGAYAFTMAGNIYW